MTSGRQVRTEQEAAVGDSRESGRGMPRKDPSAMGREELEQRIAAAEEELEDLMAERSLMLRGTSVHIGGKRAQRMKDEFEEDEARLRAELDRLRARRDGGCAGHAV